MEAGGTLLTLRAAPNKTGALVVLCQWHLRHQAEVILVGAKRHGRRDPLYRALSRAFGSAQTWGRFKKLAETSGIQALDAWVTVKDDLVRRQLRHPVKPLTVSSVGARQECRER